MNLAQALRFTPPPSLPPSGARRDTSPVSTPFSSPHFGVQKWGDRGGQGREGIAFSGAGGKSTALFQLARQLPLPVIATSTTHLHVDQVRLADAHWMGQTPADFSGLEDHLQGVMLITGPVNGDRTTGLPESLVYWLRELCGYHDLPLLIEADGSRQRPLKAPAEHEPVIPAFVDTVVVVAGLSGVGKPLTEEYVHRPEIFARLSGLVAGEIVSLEAVVRVLTHPEGGLKNIPAAARRVALLNQADTPELQSIGGKMAQELLAAFDAVVVGSLQSGTLQTFEHTAGLILAAGEAKRYGQPKQLLDWHGKPFIRQVAETALAAGLSPVVVVTGANTEPVSSAVQGLPLTILHNPAWKNGQSTSIQTGLQALLPPPSLRDASPISTPLSSPHFGDQKWGDRGGQGREGAAIFLLADQPQVTPTVLRALVERHSLDLSPIVAPQVQGQRANPVLFDRATFPELMSLSGDVGGRAIFSKFPVTYLPWHDESLLADVDTPEDYRRLTDG